MYEQKKIATNDLWICIKRETIVLQSLAKFAPEEEKRRKISEIVCSSTTTATYGSNAGRHGSTAADAGGSTAVPHGSNAPKVGQHRGAPPVATLPSVGSIGDAFESGGQHL